MLRNKIAEKIITYGIQNSMVSPTCRESYIYAIDLFFHAATTAISMILIGVWMQKPLESFFFLILYQSLRRFTGGFHFSSNLLCYLSSCLMTLLVLMIMKYWDGQYQNLIAVSSFLIILFLSPVEAVTKPLDELEHTVFQKRAIFIAVSILCIDLFGQIIQNTEMTKLITVSFGIVSCMAIAGIIKNKQYKQKEI